MKTFDEMRETAKAIAEARFSREASFHSHSAFYAMAAEFAKEFLELEAIVRRQVVPAKDHSAVKLFHLLFGGLPGYAGFDVETGRDVVGVTASAETKTGKTRFGVTTSASPKNATGPTNEGRPQAATGLAAPLPHVEVATTSDDGTLCGMATRKELEDASADYRRLYMSLKGQTDANYVKLAGMIEDLAKRWPK